MKTKATLMSMLLVAAVGMTPAFANYFSDPVSGRNLNVGSAPNPTPQELRIIGDSDRGLPPYANVSKTDLAAMQYKSAFSDDDVLLGHIVSVDPSSNTLVLQTPEGAHIWFPASYFVNYPDEVRTTVITKADVQAIANTSIANQYIGTNLTALEGRTVFGANGLSLGYILAVDEGAGLVELQTPGGIGVAMPAYLLAYRADRLEAPATTRQDVADMALMQTGSTVAEIIDLTERG
jgi:hypothetical protein